VVVLNRDSRAPGLIIACAVVPFHLMMMTVMNALESTRDRAPIIMNMAFPRILIPLVSAATECAAFAASLLLLIGMMAVYGVAPTLALLWLPVLVALTVAFAVALAYPASLFGLWHRELRPFAISLMRTLFFLAAGLVALDQITGTANDLVRINPLTAIFESYRAVLAQGRSPAVWEIAYPLAVATVLLVVAVPVFRRDQRDFAKVAE
jgi:lipopolysaccharide transport system permease protein